MPDSKKYNLVFDLGGVLVDWNPRHLYRSIFRGDLRAMEDFLQAINFPQWNESMDRGRPFAEAVADLSARFPNYARAIEAFDTRWEEVIAGPIQGSVQIALQLRANGIPLYCLTNISQEKYGVVRKKYTFLEQFRWIMRSGEFGLVKPDPRIFELFLERTGVRNKDCIFVDDSEANVLSARALGWNTVLFRSPSQLARELERFGLKTGPIEGTVDPNREPA